MFLERTYLVDSRDADHQGQCRPSAVLGFLQEAATVASMEIGVDRAVMLERYNCFWMMARLWLKLDRPLRWSEEVTVRTWHRSPKGATSYRDFDLLVGGRPVGQAVSAWVLADHDTHRLFRLDKVAELHENTGEPGLAKEMTLARLKLPQSMAVAQQRRLHYSETDVNAHVNNTRYADFACDALRLERLTGGAFVSELHISFLAECKAGDELELEVGRGEGMDFVRGVGGDGRPRFEAGVTLTGADDFTLDIPGDGH